MARGIRITMYKKNQMFLKRPTLLLKWICRANCLTSNISEPLDIKLHSVPNLKALDCEEDIFGGQGCGSTFP